MHKYKLYKYNKYNHINYNPMTSFFFFCMYTVSGMNTLHWPTNYRAHIWQRLSLHLSSVLCCLYFLIWGCDSHEIFLLQH